MRRSISASKWLTCETASFCLINYQLCCGSSFTNVPECMAATHKEEKREGSLGPSCWGARRLTETSLQEPLSLERTRGFIQSEKCWSVEKRCRALYSAFGLMFDIYLFTLKLVHYSRFNHFFSIIWKLEKHELPDRYHTALSPSFNYLETSFLEDNGEMLFLMLFLMMRW